MKDDGWNAAWWGKFGPGGTHSHRFGSTQVAAHTIGKKPTRTVKGLVDVIAYECRRALSHEAVEKVTYGEESTVIVVGDLEPVLKRLYRYSYPVEAESMDEVTVRYPETRITIRRSDI
jgi:hypothetical protein